jgi:SAM-dependent methyltransferase
MASVTENRNTWTTYDWSQAGDEWSDAWGTTEQLFRRTIMPRIHRYVPTGTILEIAPGFGRMTQYLLPLCERLVLVDVTPRCIDACRARFASATHVTYHVNDGKSLAGVPDGTVDFAFSWDSLVHAEMDVLDAYLSELSRTLTADGVGFLHHSNIGAYVRNGRLPFWIDNKLNGSNWRGATVTARRFEERCQAVGLQCIRQEVVSWYPAYSTRWGPHHRRLYRLLGRFFDRYTSVLNDCFSTVCRPGSRWARPNEVVENRVFMAEAASVVSGATVSGSPSR